MKPGQWRYLGVLLIVLSTIVMSFGVAGLLVNWLDRPASEFAEWWAATSTAAALAAASIAAIFAADTVLREASRDKARVEAEQRAQASLVAVWPGRDTIHINGNMKIRPGAHVRNASDVPVTNGVIYVEAAWLPPDRNGDESLEVLGLQSIGLIPPAEEPTFQAFKAEWLQRFVRETRPPREAVGWTFDGYRVGIGFRDAAGNWWARTSDGKLHDLGFDDDPDDTPVAQYTGRT